MSPDRASDGMGNDPEFPTVGFVVRLESGADSPFCFFLGCGSVSDDDRCPDRAGTGMVVRVVTRGWVITVLAPAIGSGLDPPWELGDEAVQW